MDFKTETQLRQEISDAWKLVDQYKRAAEVYAAKCDHAKACYDRAVRVLTGIHALLYPKTISTSDGRTMVFRPKDPDPHQVLQELSDRIRALPDELETVDAAMNEAINDQHNRTPRSGGPG